MTQTPRVCTPAFEAQVALAALKRDKPISVIAAQFGIHHKLVQASNKRPRAERLGKWSVS
jgi:hypothetical protein